MEDSTDEQPVTEVRLRVGTTDMKHAIDALVRLANRLELRGVMNANEAFWLGWSVGLLRELRVAALITLKLQEDAP